jgi:anthranilate synthase component 1
MKQPLTLYEFEVLAKKSQRVAVFTEILVKKLTPLSVYSLLQEFYDGEGVIFENLCPEIASRHSFLCFNPIKLLKIKNDDPDNPLVMLRHFQSQLAYATRPDVANLITGSVGFITYDAIRHFEDISDRHPHDPSLPILYFNFYSIGLTFDHERQTLLISTIVEVDHHHEQAYKNAQQTIADITQLLATAPATNEKSTEYKVTTPHTEVDISDSDFIALIKKAKDYIIRGDAFQIVLSRCFRRPYSVKPLEIYKILCQIHPAPFMFYFPTESGVIIGASPERLIRVHNKQITVNPIAGTRKSKKGVTEAMIETDLLNDKKEVAEHLMLVDLARNDIGAVSDPGSVEVTELLKVKHYSHISHITSTVTGQLQDKHDALDAFAAAFPAGTLSGAPKIRAMNIIDELETSCRGLYGGAICRFDLSGNFDSAIAIRMAILQDGIATIRTGAGIVYDSNPDNEVQETYQKAQSMLDAIGQAQGE